MQIINPTLHGDVQYQGVNDQTPKNTEPHKHANLSLLERFTITEDGHLQFDNKGIGSSSLSNEDLLKKFETVDGILCFDGNPVDTVGHQFSNEQILEQFSIDQHGVLLFNGDPVDTVGQQFLNAAILEKFSVVDGKLFFDGSPVDTTGSVFDNDAVLRMLSQDAQGGLLFNGQPIEGGSGTSLPNADDLKRLAVDENGQLTVDGTVVSSSGGAVTLSVTKLGAGTALIKSVVGTDIQTRSLVAGSNVTLDVSGDEVKINSSLNGAVSASSTFTKSDDFTRSAQVISLSYATKLRAIEPSISDSGLVFQATLCDDTNSAINGVALSSKGTAPTLVETPLFRNERALKCNVGCLVVPEGTTASVTAPSTWFSGTKDWCIELEFARDTSKLGTFQNLASNYTDSYANASLWIGIGTDNRPYIGIGYGTTVSQSLSVISSVAITDSNKHHLAIVRQGSTYTLYIDGVSRGTATSTQSNNAPAYGFYLGSSITSGSPFNPFYGYLRNVRVWNFAKYTSGFTVPAVSYPTSGDRYLTMAGKLLSASFWKQINSLSVVSTETATAYLKWLMLDSNGVWTWDSTNNVWVTATLANVLTSGMTTANLISAMSNNAWNYRSDTIGFYCAFVTDGTTTPVLTAIQLNAIQSADKTAGHSIEDGAGTVMTQRTIMQFKNATVTDNGSATVITVPKDSADLLHAGNALSTVVGDLINYKGTLAAKKVDVSSGLVDGAILAYDQAADKFKPAVKAVGSAGNGLYKTAPFTIAAGEEATVAHQSVNDGRAITQVDAVLPGSSVTNSLRALLEQDRTITNLFETLPWIADHRYMLPHTLNTVVKGAGATFPMALCIGAAYVVDDYLYVLAGATTNWASSTSIYRAPISAPTTWTLVGNSPISFSSINGSQVFRYGDKLYIFGCAGSASVHCATLDAPATWTAVGTLPAAVLQGGAFIVGSRVYVFGGQVGGVYTPVATTYSADMGDLNTWRTETAFPVAIGRMCCYQYGDYQYVLGGETSFDATYSNKVYRSHKDTPTTWTQIGTLPTTVGSATAVLVHAGRVFLIGGRQNASSYLSTLYSADAAAPTAWTSHAALTTARQFAINVMVEDTMLIIGGFNGGWLASVETYTVAKAMTAVVSGDIALTALNTTLLKQITRFEVNAAIPTNSAIYAAVAFDGVWCYYDSGTSAWVQCASMDQALTAHKSVVLNTGYQYYIQGLETFNLNGVKSVQVALRLVCLSGNAMPQLRKCLLTAVGIDSYEQVTAGRGAAAEVGIRHAQGTYDKTLVKNKTASAMTVVVKVYDGYGTGA